MVQLNVEEQKEWSTLPPESIVHLRVQKIEDREIDGARGTWTKLNFEFKILGILHVSEGSPEDYEDLIGERIFGGVGANLTTAPENRLRLWAEAIMKVELGVGDGLDTDNFIGREVRGISSTYPKKSVNPATGKPFIGHQIESLLPYGESLIGSGTPTQGSTQQQVDPWTSSAPAGGGAAPGGWGWETSNSDEPPF